MAYEKHTWETGETITAEKLNHMEDGISQSGDNSESQKNMFVIHITSTDPANFTATIEETYADILAAYSSGKLIRTMTPMFNVQYGTQRYYGNVIDARGIGYPQNYIELRWYQYNGIVTMIVYEDGRIWYQQPTS